MTFTFRVYYEDDSIVFRRKDCYKLVRAKSKERALTLFEKKFPYLYPLIVV